MAALEAAALDRCLSNGLSREGVWRRFFGEAGQIIDTPWMIASGSDFAFDGVTGTRPAGTDAINWYLSRVVARVARACLKRSGPAPAATRHTSQAARRGPKTAVSRQLHAAGR